MDNPTTTQLRQLVIDGFNDSAAMEGNEPHFLRVLGEYEDSLIESFIEFAYFFDGTFSRVHDSPAEKDKLKAKIKEWVQT